MCGRQIVSHWHNRRSCCLAGPVPGQLLISCCQPPGQPPSPRDGSSQPGHPSPAQSLTSSGSTTRRTHRRPVQDGRDDLDDPVSADCLSVNSGSNSGSLQSVLRGQAGKVREPDRSRPCSRSSSPSQKALQWQWTPSPPCGVHLLQTTWSHGQVLLHEEALRSNYRQPARCSPRGQPFPSCPPRHQGPCGTEAPGPPPGIPGIYCHISSFSSRRPPAPSSSSPCTPSFCSSIGSTSPTP